MTHAPHLPCPALPLGVLQEFMSAFQVLQDDLSREAEGRLEVESQLVAAQQKVRAGQGLLGCSVWCLVRCWWLAGEEAG